MVRCEGVIDGARCINPTTFTKLTGRVRCEVCAPGKSNVCVPCGITYLNCNTYRKRHQYRAHGEVRPLNIEIDGLIVVAGVYVDGVLGAYMIKEDAVFERIVRVLKCERCPGISGRTTDNYTA